MSIFALPNIKYYPTNLEVAPDTNKGYNYEINYQIRNGRWEF